MKKLITNLILILCFGSFISATPGLCDQQGTPSNIMKSDVFAKEEAGLQEDVNTQIHPLNILSFRIN